MKTLKEEYEINLQCDTCGGEDFDTLLDESLKCLQCGRRYNNQEELEEYNQERISQLNDQIEDDINNYINDELGKLFK